MNRIVREQYPVSQLPDDLRQALPGQSEVRLTIDWGDDGSLPGPDLARPRVPKSLEELYAMAEPTFGSLEEVAAHVCALRDDWT